MIAGRSLCRQCRRLIQHSSASPISSLARPASTQLQRHDQPLRRREQLRYASSQSQTTDTTQGDGETPSTLMTQSQRRDEVQTDAAAESYVVAAHQRAQHIRDTTGSLGANVEPYYQPLSLITNPPTAADLTLEMLMAAQAHLGHATSLWNPANSRYIFGIRQGIHIISLEHTAAHLKRAARVVQGVAERGGLILFAGTRPGHEPYITRAAQVSGQYHLFEDWVPGTITNGMQTLRNCGVMAVDVFDRPVPQLQEKLSQYPIAKPDLIVCCNVLENYILLHEAGMAGIPTIGIVDTDVDSTWVTYPIPANDDSLRTVGIIAGVLGNAAKEGREIRLENAKNGKVEYIGARGLALDPKDLKSRREDKEQDSSSAELTPARALDPARKRFVAPDEAFAEAQDELAAAPVGQMGSNPPGIDVAEHVQGPHIKSEVPRPRRQREAEDKRDLGTRSQV